MKKKEKSQRVGDSTQTSVKSKQTAHSKSTAFAKKKQPPNNKENMIQITQQLQPVMSTCLSKQFMHSRDSLKRTTRSAFQQVLTSNFEQPVRSRQLPSQKQQQIFDRRLSLKCLNSKSQQFQAQKSQRLSMMPPRRQSFGPQFEERQSLYSGYTMSQHSQQSRITQQSRPSLGREVIITNLMHKLEHQQDLRSIIESKLRSNCSQQLYKDRKNQSYLTDFTEQTGNNAIHSKLKYYQNQMTYFKNVIRELTDKMNESQRVSHKKDRKENDQDERSSLTGDILALFKEVGRCGSSSKSTCTSSKSTCTIGTQTQTLGTQTQTHVNQRPNRVVQSGDFMDNLQRTLKVLSDKH